MCEVIIGSKVQMGNLESLGGVSIILLSSLLSQIQCYRLICSLAAIFLGISLPSRIRVVFYLSAPGKEQADAGPPGVWAQDEKM